MVSGPVLAEFPDKPVTLVVPFAAGGPTDKVARDLAEELRGPPGGTVTVENVAGEGGPPVRPGGQAQRRWLHAAGASHRHGDGAAAVSRAQVQAAEDFGVPGPGQRSAHDPGGAAQPSGQQLARAGCQGLDGRTDRAQLAHAGIGSASHLCGLLFQAARKADGRRRSARAPAPAMADLIAGKVDLMCDQTSNTLSPIEAGKVKAYGSRPAAGSVLAKLPTLDEAGLRVSNITIWNGVYAPARPRPCWTSCMARSRPHAVARVPEAPARAGAEVVTDARSNPAEHRKFVQSEISRWGPILKSAAQYGDWLD